VREDGQGRHQTTRATQILLTFATWNDLGEGTGINRNYDYYNGGKWLPPDYFMNVIRKSQMTPVNGK
jgi:hypothetical protein